MCIGYDPFCWADCYQSEEEYIEDLEKEIENGKTRNNEYGNTKTNS